MNLLSWRKNNDEDDFREEPEEESKAAAPGLFDYIKYLTSNKKSWNQLSDVEKKGFNVFMINKALSMNPLFACLIADMQKYTMGEMPVETVYYLYHKVLPAKTFYTKWIKSKKESEINSELIDVLATHFQESKRNTIDYINMLDESEIVSILEKYGKDEKQINKLLKKPTEKSKTKTTRKKSNKN